MITVTEESEVKGLAQPTSAKKKLSSVYEKLDTAEIKENIRRLYQGEINVQTLHCVKSVIGGMLSDDIAAEIFSSEELVEEISEMLPYDFLAQSDQDLINAKDKDEISRQIEFHSIDGATLLDKSIINYMQGHKMSSLENKRREAMQKSSTLSLLSGFYGKARYSISVAPYYDQATDKIDLTRKLQEQNGSVVLGLQVINGLNYLYQVKQSQLAYKKLTYEMQSAAAKETKEILEKMLQLIISTNTKAANSKYMKIVNMEASLEKKTLAFSGGPHDLLDDVKRRLSKSLNSHSDKIIKQIEAIAKIYSSLGGKQEANKCGLNLDFLIKTDKLIALKFDAFKSLISETAISIFSALISGDNSAEADKIVDLVIDLAVQNSFELKQKYTQIQEIQAKINEAYNLARGLSVNLELQSDPKTIVKGKFEVTFSLDKIGSIWWNNGHELKLQLRAAQSEYNEAKAKVIEQARQKVSLVVRRWFSLVTRKQIYRVDKASLHDAQQRTQSGTLKLKSLLKTYFRSYESKKDLEESKGELVKELIDLDYIIGLNPVLKRHTSILEANFAN